jgi:hypothetical protein
MTQVIGKRRTWDRMIFGTLHAALSFADHLVLAISFHLMDYDKDLGLCSVRQPYADVYTVMKNQSHASDSSNSTNQGMAVGAKMTESMSEA